MNLNNSQNLENAPVNNRISKRKEAYRLRRLEEEAAFEQFQDQFQEQFQSENMKEAEARKKYELRYEMKNQVNTDENLGFLLEGKEEENKTADMLFAILKNSYRMRNILDTLYAYTHNAKSTIDICLDVLEEKMPAMIAEQEKRTKALSNIRKRITQKIKNGQGTRFGGKTFKTRL